MGEAGYGTAMYGEDTETHEVEHGADPAADDDEDEFGYEEPDDSAAYQETADDIFGVDDEI